MGNGKFGQRGRRAGARSDRSGWGSGNGGRPITADLTREQKAACTDDFKTAGIELDQLIDCINAGFKLSLSPDFKNGSIIATLTDRNEASDFYGCWVSIRASEPLEAMHRALWVTGTLCEGDWSILEQLSHEAGDDW